MSPTPSAVPRSAGAGADEEGGEEDGEEDEDDEPNLHSAASNGDKEALEQLLKDGADVNLKDGEGRTALHFACGYGEKECAEALIAAKADADATDNNGNTALHCALLPPPLSLRRGPPPLPRAAPGRAPDRLLRLLRLCCRRRRGVRPGGHCAGARRRGRERGAEEPRRQDAHGRRQAEQEGQGAAPGRALPQRWREGGWGARNETLLLRPLQVLKVLERDAFL